MLYIIDPYLFGGVAPFDAFGPLQWLKPETLSGYADNAEITLWPDSSIHGYNATAVGSTGPNCKTAILNGFRVARFASTGTVFSPGPGTVLNTNLPNPGASAYEAVIVLKALADPQPEGTKQGFWSMTGAHHSSALYAAGGEIYDNFCTNDVTNTRDVGNPAGSLAAWNIYSVYSAPNDWAAYMNRILLLSSSTNVVSNPNASYLGASNLPDVPLFLPYFNGDIVEFIIWARKLTTLERTAVWDYLQAKYLI